MDIDESKYGIIMLPNTNQWKMNNPIWTLIIDIISNTSTTPLRLSNICRILSLIESYLLLLNDQPPSPPPTHCNKLLFINLFIMHNNDLPLMIKLHFPINTPIFSFCQKDIWYLCKHVTPIENYWTSCTSSADSTMKLLSSLYWKGNCIFLHYNGF